MPVIISPQDEEGQPHGTWIWSWSDGNPQWVDEFLHGNLHGRCEGFYSSGYGRHESRHMKLFKRFGSELHFAPVPWWKKMLVNIRLVTKNYISLWKQYRKRIKL